MSNPPISPTHPNNINIYMNTLSSFSRKSVPFLIFFLLILLSSCGGGKDKLESEIKKVTSNPELQSEQGLDLIASVILSNPDIYKSYLNSDGRIDMSKLAKAVEKVGKQGNPDFKWDITAYGGIPKDDLKLNLYLERSGSMTGYDARTTSGNFKQTINELITRFPRVNGRAGRILIVNDNIYPFEGSFEEFVQIKDVFDATKGVGDPSFTDFASIFESMLQDTVPENINVLISDLIYSPFDTQGVSPAKIFNEEQSVATSIFQKHADKSVIVVQLTSDFDGLYYPYNSPQTGLRYKGQRPYYAVITGSAMAIYKLLHDSRYAPFTDFKSMPGYKEDYIFSRNPLTLSYYSLLPRGKGNKGSYAIGGAEDGEAKAHRLKDIKGDGQHKISFRIAANLQNIPGSESFITNPVNYSLKGASDARILSIEPIDESMKDARNRRFLDPATHLFTIEVNAEHLSPLIEISLLNPLPKWIETAGNKDDSNVNSASFPKTTFGVDYLLRGIYRAYHAPSETPELFTIKIATK